MAAVDIETADMQMAVDQLCDIEKRIASAEGDAVVARWEFGRELLERKEGKQLPKGLRERLAAEPFKLNATEISRRMKLAEKLSTREQLEDACNKWGSWRQIIANVLTTRRATAKTSADDDAAWVESAKMGIAKLLEESGLSDTRHDALVGILARALNSVTYPVASQ